MTDTQFFNNCIELDKEDFNQFINVRDNFARALAIQDRQQFVKIMSRVKDYCNSDFLHRNIDLIVNAPTRNLQVIFMGCQRFGIPLADECVHYLYSNASFDKKYNNRYFELANQAYTLRKNNLTKNSSEYQAVVNKLAGDTKDPIYAENYIDQTMVMDRNYINLFSYQDIKSGYIYQRFNILINDESVFNDIDLEYFKKVNSRHVTAILNKILLKFEVKYSDEAFLLAINLYNTFGYDNTNKLLNDAFSKMTIDANRRVDEYYFGIHRRRYRNKNPHLFYTDELSNHLISSLRENEKNLLREIIYDAGEGYIDNLFRDLVNLINSGNEIGVKKIISKEIIKRENRLKQRYVGTNSINNINKNFELSYNDLIKHFGAIQFAYKLDSKGNIIVDSELNHFLLGNTKTNNDCFLRIIFNNCLENEKIAANYINNFRAMKDVIIHSGEMSIDSLLDVIETDAILKYHTPNELLDLSERNLLLLQTNMHYCVTKNASEILSEAVRIRKNQRKKIYSTIPFLTPERYNEYNYETIPYGCEELLTIGINTNCCFKAAGTSAEFYEYCLTNENASIIKISNEKGVFMVPVIRCGNGLFANSLEGSYKVSNDEIPLITKALEHIFNEMIEKSRGENNPLEFACITNLQQNIDTANRPFIESDNDYVKEKLKLDFYTNYDSKSLYILAGDYDLKFFQSEAKYYSPRPSTYSLTNTNGQLITNIINAVNYLFEELNNPTVDRGIMKKNYKFLKVEDFDMIIGNYDWFLGVTNDGEIISRILPYDPRAYQELKNGLEIIKKRKEAINGEKGSHRQL